MPRRSYDTGEYAVTVTVQAAEPLDGPTDLLNPRPLPAAAEEQPPATADRLVPEPDAGLGGWFGIVRAAVAACWAPLLMVTTFCAGLPQLLSGSVSEAVVVAPVLTELGGGAGLLLLPLLWVTVVAVKALLLALCVAAVVALVTGWAADGRRPGIHAVARLVGHRIGPLWVWFLILHTVEQVVVGLGMGGMFGWVLLAVSWAVAAVAGLLAPVVLFERARGPRRALRLLTRGPRPAMVALALAAVVPVLVPALARELSAGLVEGPAVAVAALLATAVGTLFWLVAATVTYAAAAAVSSGRTVLTAPFLKAALAAEEA